MFLLFNYPKKENLTALKLQNITLQYAIDEHEYFFENSAGVLLLSSNANIDQNVRAFFNEEKENIEALESTFLGDYFAVYIRKYDERIIVLRDKSGINTGYYCHNEKNKQLIIANMIHDIVPYIHCNLNKEAVYQFLYFDYLWDGQTFYDQIKEVTVGGHYSFDEEIKLVEKKEYTISFSQEENSLSEEENIVELRKQIVASHQKYLNHKNTVLLSGGIDSVAMIIALDDSVEKNKIKAHSYRVKNAINADETIYAKSIADHLNIDINIFDRELSEISVEDFETLVLKMNNPYMGAYIFNNNFQSDKNITYYAGQDTRLHTPSVNQIDLLAFSFVDKPVFIRKILNAGMLIIRPFLKLFKNSSNRKLRGLLRTSYIFDLKKYIYKYYFKLDESYILSYNLPKEMFAKIKDRYHLDLKNVKNKRDLYNTIVALKWKEQYVSDISYLQDMARLNNTRIAMPFYDMDVAKFKATIPFNLSIKTMKGKSEFGDKDKTVFKYLLRMSLKNKIDKKTLYRSKAAPATFYVLFNEGLNKAIKSILISDLNAKTSFIKEYNLENFICKFINSEMPWEEKDQGYLVKIYHAAALTCYHKNSN